MGGNGDGGDEQTLDNTAHHNVFSKPSPNARVCVQTIAPTKATYNNL